MFSTRLKNFLLFRAKLKLSSANLSNLEESEICGLGKGLKSLLLLGHFFFPKKECWLVLHCALGVKSPYKPPYGYFFVGP